MISGQFYHSKDISLIVRLQKAVRRYRQRRDAVENYLTMLPEDLQKADILNVKRMLMRYGPFEYLSEERENLMGFEERETREAMLLQNGTVYVGEWRKDSNTREGRGVQVWPDGSLYEGYWKNNKANQYGRLLHKDGDIYQGEWLDDKAHGVGFYYHQDGSLYRGFWKNDT
mmetsp:Transcript_950/g.1303  ORF Transcript_950/g.1303 Transcript_950/m.1303 type:complete len:171 (-) Transcript_950:809-1321(-)